MKEKGRKGRERNELQERKRKTESEKGMKKK